MSVELTATWAKLGGFEFGTNVKKLSTNASPPHSTLDIFVHLSPNFWRIKVFQRGLGGHSFVL